MSYPPFLLLLLQVKVVDRGAFSAVKLRRGVDAGEVVAKLKAEWPQMQAWAWADIPDKVREGGGRVRETGQDGGRILAPLVLPQQILTNPVHLEKIFVSLQLISFVSVSVNSSNRYGNMFSYICRPIDH